MLISALRALVNNPIKESFYEKRKKTLYKQHAHYNKFNPNYYPLVVSVDSSSIESTYIFPETLNKMHKCMCGNTSKQNKFLISQNTK